MREGKGKEGGGERILLKIERLTEVMELTEAMELHPYVGPM